MLLLVCWSLQAQEDRLIPLSVPVYQDSLRGPLLPPNILNDSIKADTIASKGPQNQSAILDQIRYSAKDYVRLSQKDKKIYLYNEAEIYYQDTELKAGIIVLDYTTNEVYAGRIKDKDGNYSQLPFFKQGTNEVIPDSIRFNFDTKKALIWNSRTEQQAQLGAVGAGNDAMKVLAERTKKENDSVYFLRNGRLTTSKDTLDPDYYIKIRKAKFVPGKKIIAGFSNMYLVQVPTPIALPFAYFPLTNNRTSGLIFPTFTSDPQRGYAIQNGGYYFPISDYVDFSIIGDFYTNGSYGFRTRSVYKKRYKFQGSVDFRFENLITSQKGFSDFSRQTIYNLQIQHSQDSKSNPYSRFSASVNLGSSSYFRNSANQVNLALTQNNNLSSSISYSKTFPAYPRIDLSMTATHNQNTNTEQINLTLPTLQMNMERIFPFAKRDGIKKGALQNINFQYSSRAENRIQTTDSLFLTGRMFENARVGARHTIPINTNFKLAKYLSVTVGGTYEDIWTFETFTRGQDPDATSNREIVLDTVKGFDRWNRYGLSASIGTTVYGTYEFKEGKRLRAIRHVMRPQLGWGYTPSFEQFYDTYTNFDGEEELYSRFEGTLNGAPSLNQSNSVSFSLSNTIEAKVMPKDSTELEPKKISLLSNLNFATSYNFEADSLKLAPISFNGGTTLLNNKLSINFTGSLDPYAIDNNGTRINTLNVNNGGSLFRLTRASINLGYSLNNDTFKRKKADEDEPTDEQLEDLNDYRAASGGRKDDLFGFGLDDRNANYAFDNENEDGDVDNPIYGTVIPWDLRLAFTSTYNNSNRQNEFTNNSLMFSGSVQLSPRWKVRVSSGYDFKNNGFNLTQLGFQRNLKSFDLRFNWVPFGRNERWDFFIGISSSILRDLKWDQRSQRNIGRR